jgi:hypothetical protein
MISISKYLYAERKNKSADPAPQSHLPTDFFHFSSCILEGIGQFVLTGDAGEELRSQLLQVGNALRADLKPAEVSQAAQSVSSILAAHRESRQRAGVEQLVEAQHIFAMLNQALVILAEGNDRGISRLATIQESLHRAATMRDMASLKASLSETMQFIRTEFDEAHKTATEELGKLETEVSSARQFLGGTRLELAGRPEGVSKISAGLTNLIPGEALYLVAYLCERLHAVIQRYGPAVAEELISRLIRERLKPVVPENTMYRWTPSSLVAVFSRPRDVEKLRKEVADLNRTPLVHKMALGGRTAVLTVLPSHLIVEGISGSPAALVAQLDKFAQVGA